MVGEFFSKTLIIFICSETPIESVCFQMYKNRLRVEEKKSSFQITENSIGRLVCKRDKNIQTAVVSCFRI